ncbi:MAG: pentapeptide repeat-containing protein, partial [Pseudomonadota bacterium]
MADTPPQIERINALTVNARNTWFVLLGALVFVGITLMGVEHIDFYGVDRATTLPLVNVEVPTRLFFAAAPILVAAIYSYFHLYLIRLWDALSDADATVNDRPLGDAITPWLITDAALYLRTQLRDEPTPSARHRLLEGSAMVLNFAIAWAFGLIVLFFLWWLSMPARTFWMTLVAGFSLFGATFVGTTSLAMLVRRMKAKQDGPQRHVLATVPAMSAVVVALPLLLALSHQRTDGSTERLALLDMVGQEIVDRPEGWVPYALAKADFYERWCKRNGRTCKVITDLDAKAKRAFENEFRQRRDIALSDITKPSWSQTGARKPNFRGSQLETAFLVNANLRRAQMEGAVLIGAQMEGADLIGAQMERAVLSEAQMEGVDLSVSHI